MTRIVRAALIGAVLVVAGARTAEAQYVNTEFPQTRFWGTGLIDIPTASVSPLSGDFTVQYAGTGFQTSPQIPLYHTGLNSQGNVTIGLFGRAEVGVTAYSGDPEQGFSGQLLLLRQQDFSATSPLRFLPNLAFGVRNVGPYSHIDRFNMGYGESVNPNGGSAPVIRVDSLHQSFSTGNTVYGVATKGFMLSDIKSSLPEVGVDLTVGYGDGLFSNHGNLPVRLYASNATGGLFYGIDATMRPTPNTLVTIMGENNAWDFNVGAQVDYRGLRAGVAVTELGAGSQKIDPTEAATAIYHYTKFSFTLGWHSNIFALFKGHFLENREAALRQQRDQMLAEVSKRQSRIAELEVLVKQYEAQNLLELEQRREAAQAELKAESEALHRLEERLKRVESQTGGQAPPPSPQTPPPSAPHR
jgi:hypothetical protein